MVSTAQIAEMLRSKRLEKNLAVQKVRDDTKISTKYILALEEGSFDVFPARVYLRGFFLLYAKYLGFENALELWQSIEKELPSSDHKDNHQVRAQSPTEVLSSSLAVHPTALSRGWGHFVVWVTEGQNWILAFIVGPVVVLGIVLGVYSYVRHRAYEVSPEKALEAERLLEPSPASKIKFPAVLANQPNSKSVPAGQDITVELRAKEEPSWISIELDSKKSFQGILSPQQTRRFTFKETAQLRLGNPKSLTLSVNSKEWAFTPQELERAPLNLELNASRLTAP